MKTLLHAQRGQALTEFIVIALALIPLFLLMPMIAKYQDIAHATEMASRYVAFDAMANNDGMSSFKPAAQLADEVRRRFYSNSDAPIKTGDTAGDFMANQNLYWRDPQGGPLIKNFSDVTVSFGGAHGAAGSDGYSAATDGAPFKKGLNLIDVKNELGLKSPGVYTGNVSVTLANLAPLAGSYASTYEQFANLNLSVTRHTSVLVDTWSGSDPAKVESRYDNFPLFPGKVLNPIETPLGIAVAAMELPVCFPAPCSPSMGPKLGELSFWRDDVPADRLK